MRFSLSIFFETRFHFVAQVGLELEIFWFSLFSVGFIPGCKTSLKKLCFEVSFGMVAYACHPSSWEAKAEVLL